MNHAPIARRGWLAATLGVGAIAALLPLTVFLVGAWLLGWQLQNVQSGSMAPTYPVGSLLVIGQIDAGDVEPGMAIVFENPGRRGQLITHRVVRLAPGPALAFVTQGDANTAVDAIPVPARLVRGRVLWAVSHLGAALQWLEWPRSFAFLVVLPAALLAIGEFRSRRAARTAATAAADAPSWAAPEPEQPV